MTCVEEIEYFQNLSITLLCVQGIFVIIFLVLSKEKRITDLLFFVGLLLFHPRFHKTISDCGEELLQGSVLFLCTTVGLIFGFQYRSSILGKIKDP